MVIGGNDLVVAVRPTLEVRGLILRHVEEAWPKMSLEKLAAGTPDEEWFIYRDSTARQSWDDWGGIDENQDTMLHFLFGADDFTVVYSHLPDAETARVAISLKKVVR